MPIFYMITGVPGSGKSTTAQKIKDSTKNNILHYEADMFFIDNNGNYNWDGKKLFSAHKWCFNHTESAMKSGLDVIVSNTSITKKDRKQYFELAKKYNYTIKVIECTGEFKNIHGVSLETVQKMKNKYQQVTLDEYY